MSDRPTTFADKITRTRPLQRNVSNSSDYLGNRPTRYSHHPTPAMSSFLKSKHDPPSEFRDRIHPLPPSPPRIMSSANLQPPHNVNLDHIDGPPVDQKKNDGGGVASVILALHHQKTTTSPPQNVSKGFQSSAVDLPTTSWTVVMTEKSGRTELYRRTTGPYLTYHNVKWKLHLRKEVR